ncbi:polymeric immunoglobulin receptor isoform X2 [Pangasianodon hypophthalmus]|uniref:polymeric immunoglobulin receptor isoform X2 n=1 Tax=Pangasianodon hypophthalmus TaxID=310915 RepID=UPI002307EE0C|nr:polymeric immunoglobulin receptor isoform X2 [Pangasianodon hypophthalmus]
MKILIIVILYIISGPVDCSDVIGYSGGSVIIISNIKWYDHNSKYICKVTGKDCTDIIRADTKRHQVHDGRFMLYANTKNFFLILIRKLKPQDAGTYRFGLGNQSNSTVNLKVHNNASCGVPKIMNAYLGQNITITCKYPGEYERNSKYVDSVDDDSKIKVILNSNTKFQNGRFSISDDRSAKVLSVNISDVREADEVFYLFGVWNGAGIEHNHSTSKSHLYDDISSTERNPFCSVFQFLCHHHQYHQCVCLCGSAADWRICTDLQTETQENTR